jgi:predicted dinucleotide-binding enzyme
MRVAVLGTGIVGRTLAGGLVAHGHEATIGTRDVAETLARTGSDAMGNPAYPQWAADHPDVRLATYADAAAGAELVVNATSGEGSIAALSAAGAENLAGKVLVDVANPLDFSAGMPPSLFVKDTDSLAEQIQRQFPDARVVKAFNIVNATIMVDPSGLPSDHTMFVSGNDADAKAAVVRLLEEFGHTDVIDLGDLTTARGPEMLLPLWLELWAALGTPAIAFKIVR